jgi:aminopeptidase YwaD
LGIEMRALEPIRQKGASADLGSVMLAVIAATAAPAAEWTVNADDNRAHEEALAGDALHGRGSATADEAAAAAYVAQQFQRYGLKPAPGIAS